MKKLEVFIQVEGRDDVFASTVDEHATWSALVQQVRSSVGQPDKHESVLLLEDHDDDIADHQIIGELAKGKDELRVHLHRCSQLQVSVHFSGQTITHPFRPSATIGRVKAWATHRLHMAEADAAEHSLEIVSTTIRPDIDTHIGTLLSHPACALAFNLVFSQRVNG